MSSSTEVADNDNDDVMCRAIAAGYALRGPATKFEGAILPANAVRERREPTWNALVVTEVIAMVNKVNENFIFFLLCEMYN